MPAVLPDTCATVNGVTIGKTELETAIRSIEARNHAPVPAEKRDEVYRGVLDNLVSYTLLKQEAVQRHVVGRGFGSRSAHGGAAQAVRQQRGVREGADRRRR